MSTLCLLDVNRLVMQDIDMRIYYCLVVMRYALDVGSMAGSVHIAIVIRAGQQRRRLRIIR